jgi:hypothetical protein
MQVYMFMYIYMYMYNVQYSTCTCIYMHMYTHTCIIIMPALCNNTHASTKGQSTQTLESCCNTKYMYRSWPSEPNPFLQALCCTIGLVSAPQYHHYRCRTHHSCPTLCSAGLAQCILPPVTSSHQSLSNIGLPARVHPVPPTHTQ